MYGIRSAIVTSSSWSPRARPPAFGARTSAGSATYHHSSWRGGSSDRSYVLPSSDSRSLSLGTSSPPIFTSSPSRHDSGSARYHGIRSSKLNPSPSALSEPSRITWSVSIDRLVLGRRRRFEEAAHRARAAADDHLGGKLLRRRLDQRRVVRELVVVRAAVAGRLDRPDDVDERDHALPRQRARVVVRRVPVVEVDAEDAIPGPLEVLHQRPRAPKVVRVRVDAEVRMADDVDEVERLAERVQVVALPGHDRLEREPEVALRRPLEHVRQRTRRDRLRLRVRAAVAAPGGDDEAVRVERGGDVHRVQGVRERVLVRAGAREEAGEDEVRDAQAGRADGVDGRLDGPVRDPLLRDPELVDPVTLELVDPDPDRAEAGGGVGPHVVRERLRRRGDLAEPAVGEEGTRHRIAVPVLRSKKWMRSTRTPNSYGPRSGAFTATSKRAQARTNCSSASSSSRSTAASSTSWAISSTSSVTTGGAATVAYTSRSGGNVSANRTSPRSRGSDPSAVPLATRCSGRMPT